MSQSVKQFLHPEGWLSTRLRFNFIDVFLQITARPDDKMHLLTA
jgi:hypothetical protein